MRLSFLIVSSLIAGGCAIAPRAEPVAGEYDGTLERKTAEGCTAPAPVVASAKVKVGGAEPDGKFTVTLVVDGLECALRAETLDWGLARVDALAPECALWPAGTKPVLPSTFKWRGDGVGTLTLVFERVDGIKDKGGKPCRITDEWKLDRPRDE